MNRYIYRGVHSLENVERGLVGHDIWKLGMNGGEGAQWKFHSLFLGCGPHFLSLDQ